MIRKQAEKRALDADMQSNNEVEAKSKEKEKTNCSQAQPISRTTLYKSI